jgi:hypothetical protein
VKAEVCPASARRFDEEKEPQAFSPGHVEGKYETRLVWEGSIVGEAGETGHDGYNDEKKPAGRILELRRLIEQGDEYVKKCYQVAQIAKYEEQRRRTLEGGLKPALRGAGLHLAWLVPRAD